MAARQDHRKRRPFSLVGHALTMLQDYMLYSRPGERLVTLAIVLRLCILYVAMVGFHLTRTVHGNVFVNGMRGVVITFFVYTLILGYVRLVNPLIFFSRQSKRVQVIVDTLFVALVHFLIADPSSGIFVLYLLPLLLAADYLSAWENVLTVVAASVAWWAVTWAIIAIFAPSGMSPLPVWWLMVSRSVFFAAFSITYYAGRRLVPPMDLRPQQAQLVEGVSQLGEALYVTETDYRLRYVDPTLEERHGSAFRGVTCYTYLTGSDTPCSTCPLSDEGASAPENLLKVTVICKDRDGQPYEALRRTVVLPGLNNSPQLIIGTVRDLTQRKALTQEIESYLSSLDSVVNQRIEKTKRQFALVAEQLSGFFRTASIAAVGGERERTLENILAIVAPLLECTASVARVEGQDPGGRPGLVLLASYGVRSDISAKIQFVPMDASSIVVDCFHRGVAGQCLDVQDGAADLHFKEAAYLHRVHSMAYFPLQFRDRNLGTWTLYRNRVHPFTQQEMQLGQAFANFLAMTVDNFQSYEARVEQAEERQRWLDAMHDLSGRLAGQDNLDAIIHRVAELAKERLDSETASVFLMEGDRLCRQAIAGLPDDWLPDESYAPGEGLTGRVVQPPDGEKYGQPIRVNQVDQDPRVCQCRLGGLQPCIGIGPSPAPHRCSSQRSGRDLWRPPCGEPTGRPRSLVERRF